MTNLFRCLVFLGLTILVGGPAGAHPGHGDSGVGPVHYLTEPVHSVWLVAPVVVAMLVAIAVIRRQRGGLQRS